MDERVAYWQNRVDHQRKVVEGIGWSLDAYRERFGKEEGERRFDWDMEELYACKLALRALKEISELGVLAD